MCRLVLGELLPGCDVPDDGVGFYGRRDDEAAVSAEREVIDDAEAAVSSRHGADFGKGAGIPNNDSASEVAGDQR